MALGNTACMPSSHAFVIRKKRTARCRQKPCPLTRQVAAPGAARVLSPGQHSTQRVCAARLDRTVQQRQAVGAGQLHERMGRERRVVSACEARDRRKGAEQTSSRNAPTPGRPAGPHQSKSCRPGGNQQRSPWTAAPLLHVAWLLHWWPGWTGAAVPGRPCETGHLPPPHRLPPAAALAAARLRQRLRCRHSGTAAPTAASPRWQAARMRQPSTAACGQEGCEGWR